MHRRRRITQNGLNEFISRTTYPTESSRLTASSHSGRTAVVSYRLLYIPFSSSVWEEEERDEEEEEKERDEEEEEGRGSEMRRRASAPTPWRRTRDAPDAA